MNTELIVASVVGALALLIVILSVFGDKLRNLQVNGAVVFGGLTSVGVFAMICRLLLTSALTMVLWNNLPAALRFSQLIEFGDAVTLVALTGILFRDEF